MKPKPPFFLPIWQVLAARYVDKLPYSWNFELPVIVKVLKMDDAGTEPPVTGSTILTVNLYVQPGAVFHALFFEGDIEFLHKRVPQIQKHGPEYWSDLTRIARDFDISLERV